MTNKINNVETSTVVTRHSVVTIDFSADHPTGQCN